MDKRTQQPSNNDPFLINYSPTDLRIASAFLSHWLPFLSKDLCRRCSQSLSDRILSIDPESRNQKENSKVKDELEDNIDCLCHSQNENYKVKDELEDDIDCLCHSLASWKDGVQENSTLQAQSPRMSYSDI